MKVFFKKALEKELAAHILFFNNKPACNICIPIKYPDKTFKDTFALRGWYAFKENEYLFPHSNFIFVEYYYGDSENYRLLGIDMINKIPLKACLIKHKQLFEEVLGPPFSLEEFMAKLEEGQSLSSLLKGNHILLGIVLGYGEESSRAFNSVITQHTGIIPPPHTETYQVIDLNVPNGCKINPVVFMGNPNSEEVKQLISTYEQELDEAWNVYKRSKDPLKIALESLCK